MSSGEDVTAVGIIASLVHVHGDRITFALDWYADLASGRRVATTHRAVQMTMPRSGIDSIVRRHYGPGSGEQHRLGVTDFEDAARETEGLESLREARGKWISTRAFLFSGGLRPYLRRRRRRWTNLRLVLAEQGIKASRRRLDAAPFSVEVTPELERELLG